jgi:hypothetical protein
MYVARAYSLAELHCRCEKRDLLTPGKPSTLCLGCEAPPNMRPLLALCALASASAQFVANVVSYGAVPDGVTLNTAAFVAATADVSAHGGGVLYVPPGRYLISPFNMTSHMELRLDNATLLASASTRGPCDFEHWDIIAPLPSYGRGRNYPGPRYTSLLHAYNVTGLRVTSNSSTFGVVDGRGPAWWACVRNGTLKVTPGHLLEVLYSENIEIDHVHFLDSPFWNLHPCVSGRNARARLYAAPWSLVAAGSVTAPRVWAIFCCPTHHFARAAATHRATCTSTT